MTAKPSANKPERAKRERREAIVLIRKTFGYSLGPVEIWDSQWGLFVIQALDGSLCID